LNGGLTVNADDAAARATTHGQDPALQLPVLSSCSCG
jgi:hypothetical protein